MLMKDRHRSTKHLGIFFCTKAYQEEEMNTPQWISEKEVSKITGRATQTLRNDRVKRQGIPYSKIHRSVRYRMDDVIDFMESRRIVPEN